MDLKEAFERHESEFLKFEDVTNKRHMRRDLCAFLLLSDLQEPTEGKIVASAEHDQIWLGVDCEWFAGIASDELIANLSRCGVFYDDEADSLSMYA